MHDNILYQVDNFVVKLKQLEAENRRRKCVVSVIMAALVAILVFMSNG